MIARSDFEEKNLQRYMYVGFPLSSFIFKDLSSYKKFEAESKKIVADFDGVFEKVGTYALYKLFFDALEEENSAIEARTLIRFAQRISLGSSPTEIFRDMKIYLQSRNLTRSQYYRACEKAAERWVAAEDAWEAVNEARKLNYKFAIISGSAQEALEKAASKIGIEEVYGTRFEFDEHDRLKEIYQMLGSAKLEQKRRIIGNEEHIVITDDMKSDYFITFGAQLSIIVADKDEKILEDERQLYVFDNKIRRNFLSLRYHLQKFEYATQRSFRTTKAKQKRTVENVYILKSALQNGERKNIIHCLQRLRNELDEFDPFSFPYGEKILIEYKFSKDADTEKRLQNEIISILKQVPEFADTETFEKSDSQ